MGQLSAQCSYNMTHNTIVNLQADGCCGSANFYDSGGPSGNYGNSENRVMRFVSGGGQRIQVVFTSFSTESCCDYLEIYDGSGTNAPLVGIYRGTTLPPAFVSLSDTITFRFVSDGGVVSSGWTATLQCVSTNIPQRYPLGSGSPTIALANCTAGLVFTDDGGTEGPYSPLVDDTVTFQPPSGQYACIAFPWQLFLHDGDTLWIGEGSLSPTTLLGVFTRLGSLGNTRGDTLVAAMAGTPLIVRFKSDGANQAQGWQAFVWCTNTPPPSVTYMGSGLRTVLCQPGRSFRFYDSGGPAANYGHNENRTLRFIAPGGARLQITFSTFSTENGPDYLEIYDGSGSSAPLVGRYVGNVVPPALTTLSDTLTMRFISDGNVSAAGWSATIQCLSNPLPPRYALTPGSPSYALDCVSGLVFTDNGGTEGNYDPLVDDTVTFRPGSGQYAVIAFPYQLSLASGDSLWIWEGTATPANLLALYTVGSSRGDTVVGITPGTSLLVRFKSDATNQAAGWQAYVYCTPNPPPSVTYLGAGLRSIVCSPNRVYRFYDSGSPGLIGDGGRSGYGNYANNEDRTITFRSQGGTQRIQLQFTSFQLENGPDYIDLYDGLTTTSPHIGRFTGTNLPPVIESLGDALTIRFRSDGTVNYGGWTATITCTGEPTPPTYTLSTPAGNASVCSALFYDDGGPDANYTHPQDRTFTFCPNAPDRVLVVRFPYQLQLANGDTLWVWEGPSSNPQQSLIAIYVRNNRSDRLSASAPGLCLTFRLKATGSAPGWQGAISCETAPQPFITWMGEGMRRTCHLLFYDSGGPNAPYSNNENRTLLLLVPSGAAGCGGLRIDFSSFSTESCCDRLRIYNGGNTGATLWNLGGNTASPNPVIGSADSMLIHFSSDGSGLSPGWIATITCTQSPSVSVSPAGPLTICPEGIVTLTATGAASYVWNTGATGATLVVSQPGTYYAIGTSPTGCQAVSNLVQVSQHPPVDTAVQLIGTTLSPVTVRPTYTYRWINCANPATVLHTGSSFTPSTAGWYAMISQDNTTNCQDTSNCRFVDVSTSATLPMDEGSFIQLYPNPASEGTAWLSAKENIVRIELSDLAGRMLQKQEGYANRWRLESCGTGTYIVRVGLESGVTAVLRWHVVR
ncbi:MAG: T9SS type A sorting domain-containing protein [Bacteroidia bacterium]|nr:T9SS type A sorting domain-containing protein [Bacteroidia bacterium]